MTIKRKLSRRSRFLKDISILGRVRILDTVSHLFSRATPPPSLVARSYAVMQDRLRTSLEEVEAKKRQLKESEEEVTRSRDFLQAIIDSLDDDMMVLDQWFHVIQANRSLSLKHAHESVIGRSCYEVTHGSIVQCKPPSCKCPMEQVWKTGIPTRVIHIHHAGISNGGKDTYVEVSASPLCDSSGRVIRVVELMRDVTDSKEQEKQIVDANHRLLALNAIASTVSQSLSLDFVLDSALQKAFEQTKAEIGGILLLDEDTKTLSYKVHKGLSDQFVDGIGSLVVGEGISGRVAETGEPLVVDDISRDPRASRAAIIGEEGLKAFIAVPLKSKEKTVGVLTIASQEPRHFSVQEVQLLAAMGNQLGVAIENAQLYRELQVKEKMQADILRKVITAQENERRRVARELHDVTSQALATLAVRLEAAVGTPWAGEKSIKKQLDELKPLLDQTSREVHRLIYDLRPSLLDDLGLAAAIRSCAHNSLDPAGIEVHFEIVGQERRLLPTVEIAAFRIVQEAITNIARHARAESAYISLEFKNKNVLVQIEDDGIGFDASQVFGQHDESSGIGLLGMKERAELLDGTLTIQSSHGKGTRIVTEIPSEQEPDDD